MQSLVDSICLVDSGPPCRVPRIYSVVSTSVRRVESLASTLPRRLRSAASRSPHQLRRVDSVRRVESLSDSQYNIASAAPNTTSGQRPPILGGCAAQSDTTSPQRYPIHKVPSLVAPDNQETKGHSTGCRLRSNPSKNKVNSRDESNTADPRMLHLQCKGKSHRSIV